MINEDFFVTGIGVRIFTVLVGIAVLTLGRKLFWLATAVAGFIVGLGLVAQFTTQLPDWLILVLALVGGGLGALLAIVLQKVAVGLAGLVLGGYTLVSLVNIFELGLGEWTWILFMIGAIIGVVLALSLLEPALILLSALAGAALVVQAANFGPLASGLLFVGLLIVGITIQTRMLPEES